MDMSDTQQKLKINDLGEVYVKWRLDEGILKTCGESPIRCISTNGDERTITANAFCRETGSAMLPYLASHPDVGFSEFCKYMKTTAEAGIVYQHDAILTDGPLYQQIINAVDEAFGRYGNRQSKLLLAYVRLRPDQKIHPYQYACMKAYIFMTHGPKRMNLCLAYDQAGEPETSDLSYIRIWIS